MLGAGGAHGIAKNQLPGSASLQGRSSVGQLLLWHLGAVMVCIGGLVLVRIRVDVAAEGHPSYRVVRADLFILSLLATTTLVLIWSFLQQADAGAWATAFSWLFVVASTVLFGRILWSKFAHMFFRPAAAT
jgi:hypothetical protein